MQQSCTVEISPNLSNIKHDFFSHCHTFVKEVQCSWELLNIQLPWMINSCPGGTHKNDGNVCCLHQGV